MTISVLICDDLPEERIRLSQMLRRFEAAHDDLELNLDTASDGAEMLAMWKPGRWDLIFLDIYMPQLNGVEAARQLRRTDPHCEFVFATTSRDHGMEGYELHAMDYLTKPFVQNDVDSVMNWFLQRKAEQRRELPVRTQEGEETVRTQEIRYIESIGHNCVIHMPGRSLSVRGSIDQLADGLDAAFFRCHKSFLLNFAHVAGVERHAFLLDSGERVPISASNLSRSKSAFLAWKTEMP